VGTFWAQLQVNPVNSGESWSTLLRRSEPFRPTDQDPETGSIPGSSTEKKGDTPQSGGCHLFSTIPQHMLAAWPPFARAFEKTAPRSLASSTATKANNAASPRRAGRGGVDGGVDRLDVTLDLISILAGRETKYVAQQVNDAGLHDRLWPHVANHPGQARQSLVDDEERARSFPH